MPAASPAPSPSPLPSTPLSSPPSPPSSPSSPSSVSPAHAPAPSPLARRAPRTLHLGAAIDCAPYGAEAGAELARLAERGALDFVTLGGGPPGAGADPAAVGAPVRIAAATDRIGLLAVAPAGPGSGTAAEVAALDRASRGRAGWAVAAGAGAVDAAEAALRTWQDMRDAGACPPDCRPVLALDATEPADRGGVARLADVALVRAVRPDRAGAARGELRTLAARAGRDPDRLLVLADLAVDLGAGELGAEPGAVPAPVLDGVGGPLFHGGPVDLADLVAQWMRAGAVDGFRVRPVAPARDLERFVNGTVALLQHRGLFRTFHPGATLREHLGLHRPTRAADALGPAALPDAYGRLGT